MKFHLKVPLFSPVSSLYLSAPAPPAPSSCPINCPPFPRSRLIPPRRHRCRCPSLPRPRLRPRPCPRRPPLKHCSFSHRLPYWSFLDTEIPTMLRDTSVLSSFFFTATEIFPLLPPFFLFIFLPPYSSIPSVNPCFFCHFPPIFPFLTCSLFFSVFIGEPSRQMIIIYLFVFLIEGTATTHINSLL